MNQLKKLKQSLQDEFISHGIKDYKKQIAARIPCTYETVRAWFAIDKRVSDPVKMAAMELLLEVKEGFKDELKIVKS